MTSFRTEIDPESPDWRINYPDHIGMMGSCFAEHIGAQLIKRRFKVDLNPFGVLFNPVSIASGLQRLISAKPYAIDDLFVRDGLWHSFDHHSRFSATDPVAVLEMMNGRLEQSSKNFRQIKYLFITFGTARVFHHLESGRIVSNCHKVPASEFQYSLLRIGDIVRLYTRIFNELEQLNPELEIVLTVSPVRYWKDGPAGNQISKSTLLLAVSELVSNFNSVNYFPAYEIFMDDLRDYRFYGEDLLHPGTAGVQYVWKKFADCYFSEQAHQISKRVEKIEKDKSHIPLNPESDTHKGFLERVDKKISALQNEYPGLDLDFS